MSGTGGVAVDAGGRADDQAEAPVDIAAAAVLGQGRGRAWTLLLLRDLRTASLVITVLGVAVAIAFGQLDAASTGSLTTTSGLVSALFTPLVLVAVGIGLRLLVAPVAYLLALEVVMRGHAVVHADAGPRDGRPPIMDRFRLASGYRSLRWTGAVKDEAVARLGGHGRVLARAEVVLRVLVGVATVLVVVVLAV